MGRAKKRYVVYEFGEHLVLEGTEEDINNYFNGDCHSALFVAFRKKHQEYAWYKEHRIYPIRELDDEDEGEDKEDESI